MKNKGALKIIIISSLLLLIGLTSFLGFYFFDMRDLDFILGRLRIIQTSNVTYSVNLKDEDYRKDDKTDIYVTNLIKNIKTAFNYNVSFNEDVIGDYSYHIVGRLETIDSKGNVLVNKNVYSNDGVKNEIDGKVLNLSSSFVINFEEYKKIYDDLVNEYNINLNGNLIFDVVIKYDVFNDSIAKDVVEEEILTVKIPLGSETTKVEVPDKTTIKRTAYSDAKNEYTSTYFIIALEFFGASILLILVLVLIMKHFYGNINDYERELSRIVNKYKGRLVKLKELPDLSKCDVLFVDDIDSLDDAAINIMCPINYVEVVKKCEAVFIVFKDNKAYVYKLSRNLKDTE